MKKLKDFLGIDNWMDLLDNSKISGIILFIILWFIRLGVIASAIRILWKYDLKFYHFILLFFIAGTVEMFSMYVGIRISMLICFIYEIIKQSIKSIFKHINFKKSDKKQMKKTD